MTIDQTLVGAPKDAAATTFDVSDVPTAPNTDPWPMLTERERDVAEMLVRGTKNREIASALGISIKTVDTHRGHILKKTETRNNVELTRIAYRHGWTTSAEDEVWAATEERC